MILRGVWTIQLSATKVHEKDFPLGKLQKPKCSFNLGIFQIGSDPPPPGILKLLGYFSVGYFFPGTFGALFRHIFPKKLGEKCPKTFRFGQTPPPIYPKVQNCWGTKSAPKLLDMPYLSI